MTVQGPSRTAIGAAIMRAAHRVLDEAPYLLDDPLALPLSGLPGEAVLPGVVQRMQQEFAQYGDAALAEIVVRDVRATILLRNRYAEDQLQLAVAHGVRQYVMLGAGLDSFAHRRPAWASDELALFELDLPATQAWKRAQLQMLGIVGPSSLHYVPVDFERQTPLQALADSDFRADEPALFSWLGVTSYLPEAAVYATLADLATAAKGSVVVFSYALKEALVDERGRHIGDVLKASVKARNEPAASAGFDPQELSRRLQAMGYVDLEDLDVATAQARYFANRRDGLQSPPMAHLMCATVG